MHPCVLIAIEEKICSESRRLLSPGLSVSLGYCIHFEQPRQGSGRVRVLAVGVGGREVDFPFFSSPGQGPACKLLP